MIGKRNDDFTLNIDLAPTILSAAGVPVPETMQGRDIADLYTDRATNQRPWRDEFYYEWFTGKELAGDYQALPSSLALVRKDSKYIHWPEYDFEQLFRLDNDPFEEKDLFLSNLTTDQTMLYAMRGRMAELKDLAKSGVPM